MAIAAALEACPDKAASILADPAEEIFRNGPKYAPVDSYPTFEEGSRMLREQILAIAANPPDGPACIKATPGEGKTEWAVEASTMVARRDERTIIAQPTREMAHQVADRLEANKEAQRVSQKAIVLEGRHNGYTRTVIDALGRPQQVPVLPNCNRYEAVERAARKGYAAGAYVCPRCPYWPSGKKSDEERVGYANCCTYYKTLALAKGRLTLPGIVPSVIVTTHAGFIAHGCGKTDLKSDWAIIDEDPGNALRTTQSWSRDELERGCETIPALRLHRSLLGETMKVAVHVLDRFYQSSQKRKRLHPALQHLEWSEVRGLCDDMVAARYLGEWCLHGKTLARFVEAGARALGHDRDKAKGILGDAAEAKAWLDRGQLYDADDEEIEELPHSLEPELAKELLKVMLEAEDDRESAYAVSLRYNRASGWQWVLDRLDPIEYDGHLVLLDAYADDELVQRYFGLDAPPMTVDVRCRCRDNVTVKHFKVKTTRKVLDDVETRSEIYDKYLWPELEKLRGKKVLFYTSKRYVEWLRARVEAETLEFEAVAYKHWWQDRGDDNYGDYDGLVVFGTPIPNIVGERNSANAVFCGEESLDWRSNSKGRVDPRVKALEDSRRDKELYQAAYRLRPANSGGKEQRIILVTEMPLPVLREMPGALQDYNPQPALDLKWIGEEIADMQFWLDDCWSTAFSAFQYGLGKEFRKWGREAIYAEPGEEPPLFMPYEEIIKRWKRIRAVEERRKEQDGLVTAFGPPCSYVRTRAGAVPVWGNVWAGHRILRALQIVTRQPGEDLGGESVTFAEPGEERPIAAAARPLQQIYGWTAAERAPPGGMPDYDS